MSEKDDMEGIGAEAVKINLDDAHEILRFKADKEEEDAAGEEGSKGTSNRRKAPKRKQSHWSQQPNAGDGPWDTSGNMETNAIDEYKKATRSLGKKIARTRQRVVAVGAGVDLCACVSLRAHAPKISSHACSSMIHNDKTYTRRSGATISRRRRERVSTRTEASLASANGSKSCRPSFFYRCRSETSMEGDHRRYRREPIPTLVFFLCTSSRTQAKQSKQAAKPRAPTRKL